MQTDADKRQANLRNTEAAGVRSTVILSTLFSFADGNYTREPQLIMY